MKGLMKPFFILFATLSSLVAYSASVTVNVATEGTLEQVLSEQSVTNITELTITGRLTAADLVYLRTGERVANVEVLDLSGVILVPSDEPYNTLSGSGALGSTTYYFYIGADSTKLNSSTDGLGQSVKKYHYYSMNLGAAFVNTLYEKVVLPSAVTELGMYSFYGCKLLQTVEAPGELEAIGRYAFYEDISLTTIDLSVITWAGECAFYGCTSLTSVDFSSLYDMGEKAFYGCNALNGTLQLPKLTHVAKYGFAGCKKVTGFEASELLKTIDDYAFSECSSIAELSLPEGLEEMGNYAFQNTKVTAVSFPKSMRIIGGHNFDGCKIESVAFSEGLESIGGGAFYGQHIKHITLPASLKYIGEEAFRGSKLESVTFTKGNSGLVIGQLAFFGLRKTTPDFVVTFAEGLETIGSSAFQECGLKSIDLPEGLKSIDYGAFQSCAFLDEVHLPSTLQGLGDAAFSGTPWANRQTADDDGILYYGTVAVKYKGELTDETVIKPKDGTLGIAAWFVYNRLEVKKVVFPSSLKTIGSQAFYHTGISSIDFPDSLETIGYEAFSGTPLTKVTIPKIINSIGKNPFSNCESLVQVTYNTRNLSSGSLGTIPALSKLIIGREVSVLPKQFVNTESSLRVTFEDRSEDSELFIGEAALPYNRMTALPLPNCRIALDDDAFSYYKNGGYYEHHASFAFEIPGVITALGKNALRETGVSGTIRLSDDVTSIPDHSFYLCKGLTAINIPNSVKSIDEYTFNNCTGLTAISIPDSVTSIGAGAFSGCTGLTVINIPDSVTNIGAGAFSGCTGLTVISIPGLVKNIEEKTFYNCTGLTAISIPGSVTSIGTSAFHLCKNLWDVYCYAEAIPSTGSYVFEYTRYRTGTLHVPEVSLNDYKTTYPWSYFGKIVALSMEDGIDMPTIEESETGPYYTLDGRPIEGKPTKQGLYIVNGRKILVK